MTASARHRALGPPPPRTARLCLSKKDCRPSRSGNDTAVVPSSMAMNLRLTDNETEALRRRAAEEGRSMNEVVRSAINRYVTDRDERLNALITRVASEDAELLERLSR
ncbi:ribbon-helix-helix protein, CopG family [Nostocoides jenkinsii]|nr:ribbon-helix-helix protein, CopG family [Tetrasphaera jenkinsii]